MKLSLRGLMKPKMASGGCVGPGCMGCQGPDCMAKGGEVKGVNKPSPFHSDGRSEAGQKLRASKDSSDSFLSGDRRMSEAKDIHKGVLSEMKAMPKPNLYAGGGEVEPGEGEDTGEDDSAMLDACASELLDAFERKDKAQILDSIKAIVMSVR